MLTSPLCTHKYPHWIVEYSKPVSNVTRSYGLMSLAHMNGESGEMKKLLEKGKKVGIMEKKTLVWI